MNVDPPEQLASVAHGRWLEIVSRYVSPETEPPVRRKYRRYGMVGVAQLSYQEDARPLTCTLSVLQISAEGLMLRSHKALPVGTPVQMEVTLEDEPLPLVGWVRHTTQTVGGYKIGVELQFPEGG